jgi:hypothetical protein
MNLKGILLVLMVIILLTLMDMDCFAQSTIQGNILTLTNLKEKIIHTFRKQ